MKLYSTRMDNKVDMEATTGERFEETNQLRRAVLIPRVERSMRGMDGHCCLVDKHPPTRHLRGISANSARKKRQ